MDKLTAYLAAFAIAAVSGIAIFAMFKLTGTNPAAKEIAALTITGILALVSGGGAGYMIGRSHNDDGEGGLNEPEKT